MINETVEKWKHIYHPSDVALLAAPFYYPPVPSMALSIFKAVLEKNGLKSGVVYPMFLMMQLMGPQDTEALSGLKNSFFYEEFCFAHLTGGNAGLTPEEAAAVYFPDRADEVASLLKKGREVAGIVVEATAQKIIAMDPHVLACSSIYSQLNASLAICRRIKELRQDIKTILGGFVHAERGIRILKDHDYLDYVSFGEGDEIFADVCRIMAGTKNGPMPYGVVSRKDLPALKEIPYRITCDMNTVPMPVFDDYMEEMERLKDGFYGEDLDRDHFSFFVRLFLEGSRGCWWGEKHPCSFCALNGLKNVYRQKNADKIYGEIDSIAKKYPGMPIQLTDNILSGGFIKEVLPLMASDENDYRVFAEIKTNIKSSELEALAKAGIIDLQPGIESLNDHLLELMGKGNNGIGHVNLLKQGMRFGLAFYWNILYGIPGEKEEDYQEMISLIPKLYHFKYPNTSRIFFEKFSRYLNDPDEYGLELVPMKGSGIAYGNDPETVSDMIFYYDPTGSFAEAFAAHSYLYDKIRSQVDEWRRLITSETPPVLNCAYIGDSVLIKDTRPIAQCGMYHLEGIHACIYKLMEEPVTESKVEEQLSGKYSVEEIKEAVKELEETALIIHLSGKYLALAVPLGDHI